jgi:ribonuclease HIII
VIDAATFSKWKLADAATRQRVEAALRAHGGYVEASEANCAYRLEFSRAGERVIVRQFTSGTLTLQLASAAASQGTALFSELAELIAQHAGPPATEPAKSTPKANTIDPATVFTGSWIGTDEAGKGDYFGPLVTAAVLVFDNTAETLRLLGVKDSKLLSDQQVRDLATQVRSSSVHRVVEIGPKRYNELLADMQKQGGSSNTLLAWAHARAIEDLLALGAATTNILIDQFTDAEYIRARLLKRTQARQLTVVAMPRAEANVAVAAASILARDKYLQWLSDTGFKLKTKIPKGASVEVENAAREIVRRFGAEKLDDLVKLHFRTTQRVLGATGPADASR